MRRMRSVVRLDSHAQVIIGVRRLRCGKCLLTTGATPALRPGDAHADTHCMSGLDQWSRMLAWQTRVLMEREGYDLGALQIGRAHV